MKKQVLAKNERKKYKVLLENVIANDEIKQP
jgi:hypothetical protein